VIGGSAYSTVVERPKRQHFVPRFYLDRFGRDKQVGVRRRDGRTFIVGTDRIAAENGFYDVEDADGAMSSVVETDILCDLEGRAASVFRSVDDSGRPPEEGSEDRLGLAVFTAVQLVRTREHRARDEFPLAVQAFADGREITRELVAEFLETRHLGCRPDDNEIRSALDFVTIALRDAGAYTRREVVRRMFAPVERLVEILTGRWWTVEHDRKQRLITSDTPVVLWRPPSDRDAYEGFGPATAAEIRLPLDPEKQLVITERRRTPTTRLNTERVRSCNADTALGCHEQLIGPPDSRELVLPRLPRVKPILRFHTGPLYRMLPDRTEIRDGEVLHTWVPRQ
jgi:hypothetical protein